MYCISLFGCVHNKNLSTITGYSYNKANEMHYFSNFSVDLSITCRVFYQINLRNSASRWISLYEYTTMHGPLNVKITGYFHCISVKSKGINSSRTKQIFIKFETREFKNFHIQNFAKYHTTLNTWGYTWIPRCTSACILLSANYRNSFEQKLQRTVKQCYAVHTSFMSPN